MLFLIWEFCSLEENPDVWADILLKKIENTDRNEEALNVIAETKELGLIYGIMQSCCMTYTAENKQ